MGKAVERLHKAINNNEQVAILQDSDCDGIMSAVIAYDFLKNQGLSPNVFVSYWKTTWYYGKQ